MNLKTLLMGVALSTMASAVAQAATTVITFDDLGAGVLVTNQYASENVLFGGDPTTLTYPGYNYSGYPYVSYPNVVYSPSDGYIDVSPVSSAFTSVGAYASDYYGLTLTAYNASNVAIGSASIGNSYGYSTWIGVSAPGIAWAQFSGSPDFFTLDNVTVSSVPEASTWVMMGLGFAGLAFASYRGRRTATAIA
jgi:hypothetical protein